MSPKPLRLTAYSTTFAADLPTQTTKLGSPASPADSSYLQEWQALAFQHNNCIPEVAYSNKLVAGNFGRGKLRIVEHKETKRGGINSVPTKDRTALNLLRQLDGSMGGHSSLLYAMAHNLCVVGEFYLVGVPFKHPDTGITVKLDWQIVSIRQISISKDYSGQVVAKLQTVIDGKKTTVTLPSDAYFARCWVPDVEMNWMADSAMRHNVSLCQEVITLTDLVNVLAKSRLQAGIFTLADELSFGPTDETINESSNDPDALDPFSEDFLRQASATLQDAGDLSAFVPLLIRGAKDYLPTQENYITFDRPLDELILRLREDAIVRIVRGMDLPSELVTGKGDTNSWSGFGIDQDFITKHISPLGNVVCNFLTRKWLRPFLMSNGKSFDEAEQFEVFFDTSEIATRPDMTKTAIELFDRNAIGIDSLRRLSGIEESDSPSREDFIKQVVLNLSKLSAPIAAVLLPLIPEFEPYKDVLVDAVSSGAPGPSGADSKARMPEGQGNGPQDTKTSVPTQQNSQRKSRSVEKGGLPVVG